MGGHHHHHHHSHENSSIKNLKLAFWVNLLFAIVEFIGGAFVNSIAIMSDAFHDLGDSLSLGTAWYLENKSKKSANDKFSFGYQRYSLLGALINGVILIVGSGFILYEAVNRILYPEESDALGMVVFAIIGIIGNGAVMLKMRSAKKMNEQVVYWHMMEDVLGWVAVLIAAVIMLFYPTPYIDPILSIGITFFILYGVIGRLKETLFFFLQGVPKDIDLKVIKEEITSLEHVHSIHETHVWSLDGENHVFSTHLRFKDISSFQQIIDTKEKVKILLSKYNFTHFTIETELENEECYINWKSK